MRRPDTSALLVVRLICLLLKSFVEIASARGSGEAHPTRTLWAEGRNAAEGSK
jgi:hypothetical protein